jgi:hypothetical protein
MKCILPLIIYLLPVILNAQRIETKKDNLVFSGFIEGIDTGSVELVTLISRDYYDLILESKSVKIIGGRFRFSGRIEYPHAAYMFVTIGGLKKHTEVFFIEAGTQELMCTVNALTDPYLQIKGSKTNQEYIEKFRKAYLPVDSLYNIYIGQAVSFPKVRPIQLELTRI